MKPTRFPRSLKERDLAELLPEDRLVYHIERGCKPDVLSAIQAENPDVNVDHLLFNPSITDDELDEDPTILPEDSLVSLAVRHSHAHLVEWLLLNGADACILLEHHVTCYHLAAVANSVELMELLLRQSHDSFSRPSSASSSVSSSPTPRYIQIGLHSDSFRTESRCDRSDCDGGVTPFDLCLFRHKNPNLCKLLLDAGTSFSFEELRPASSAAKGASAGGSGGGGGDSKLSRLLSTPFPDSVPLLHWAFSRRDGELCRCLLALGCSPFIRDDRGNTLLHRLVGDAIVRLEKSAIRGGGGLADVPRESLSGRGSGGGSSSSPRSSGRGGGGGKSVAFSIKQMVEILCRSTSLVASEGSDSDGGGGSSSNSSSGAFGLSPEIVNAENIRGLTALEMAVFGFSGDRLFRSLSGGSSDEEDAKGSSDLGVRMMDFVRLLVRAGASVEHKSSRTGLTVLHRAAAEGKSKIIADLFQTLRLKTAPLDDWGSLPLHWAANENVARVLLERRADVNASGSRGMSPLHCAVIRNAMDVVSLLLGAKRIDVRLRAGELEQNVVHLCAFYGRVDACKMILQKGSAKVMIEEKDKTGATPLQLAIRRDQAEMALFLLGEGASICPAVPSAASIVVTAEDGDDEIVSTGRSSNLLRMAIEKGMNGCVEEILKRPDVESIVNEVEDGLAPLHIAVLLNRLKCVKALLASGKCSPNLVVQKSRCTPLMLSCRGCFNEIALELLGVREMRDKGVIQHKDHDGRTAMHYAVGVVGDPSSEDVCDKILALGLDVDARDDHGMTPLHAACAAGNHGAVRFLITKGHANVNAIDDLLRTPLHVAVEFGSVYSVRYLALEIGVPLTTLDALGRSPLLVASEAKQTECGRILVKEQSRRKRVGNASASGAEGSE